MKKFLYVFGIMGLFAQSDAMQVGVIKISRKCPKQTATDSNHSDMETGTMTLLPNTILGEERNSIKKVVVSNRVKTIKANSLSFCSRLSQVEFEQGIQLDEIEDSAFCCTAITQIVIPSSVTKFGRGCFFQCVQLNQIAFADGFQGKEINDYFCAHTAISKIVIPQSVEKLGEGCFAECPHLRVVQFEAGIQLERIPQYAFRGLKTAELSIPDSVKILCNCCFENCNIDRLVLGEDSKLQSVDNDAFSNATVKEISAPERLRGIIVIPGAVFCPVSASNDTSVGILTELSDDDQQTELSDDDQQNVDGIAAPQPVVQPCLQPQAWGTRVAFPIPAITQRPVVRSERVAAPQPQPVVRPERVTAPQPQPVVQPERVAAPQPQPVVRTVNCNLGFGVVQLQVMGPGDIFKVIIPNYVTIIMAAAFRNYEGLTELIFQENSSLRIIDMYAFENTGITNLSLPASVKELSEACFRNCQKLQSVVFSSNASLTHIIKAAFSNTAIIDIAIPTRVKSIGGRCFANCKQLRSIAFPPHINIHTLCYNVFSSTPIRSIVIPENVHTIGNKCFMNCQCLQDVIFQATGPLKICENAFQKTGIKRIEIPAYVKNIDKECFFESRLQEVKFARRNTGINIDKTAFVSPTLSIVYVQDGLLGQIRSCMPEKVKYYSLEGSALHPEGVGARPVFPSLPGGAVTPQPGVQPEGVAARPVFPSLPGAAVTPQPGVHPEGVAVRPVFPVLETDEQSEDVDEQP